MKSMAMVVMVLAFALFMSSCGSVPPKVVGSNHASSEQTSDLGSPESPKLQKPSCAGLVVPVNGAGHGADIGAEPGADGRYFDMALGWRGTIHYFADTESGSVRMDIPLDTDVSTCTDDRVKNLIISMRRDIARNVSPQICREVKDNLDAGHWLSSEANLPRYDRDALLAFYKTYCSD